MSAEEVPAEVTRLIDGQDDFTTRKAMLRVFVEQVRIESREVNQPDLPHPGGPGSTTGPSGGPSFPYVEPLRSSDRRPAARPMSRAT